jgi:hypothetical protein
MSQNFITINNTKSLGTALKIIPDIVILKDFFLNSCNSPKLSATRCKKCTAEINFHLTISTGGVQ